VQSLKRNLKRDFLKYSLYRRTDKTLQPPVLRRAGALGAMDYDGLVLKLSDITGGEDWEVLVEIEEFTRMRRKRVGRRH